MPEFPTARRGPGRPRDLEKRAAIVQAARKLFLQDGFAAVTMEAIAAAAGVSKMTLYGYFRDKEVVFEAAAAETARALTADMSKIHAEGGSLAEALCALGRAILALITRPELVGVECTLMLASNPGLGRRIYEAGPATTLRAVASVLAEAAARGEVGIEAPEAAAEDLLALWEGDLMRRLRMGIGPSPSEDEIDRRVRAKTATFLRAYAPGRTAVTAACAGR